MTLFFWSRGDGMREWGVDDAGDGEGEGEGDWRGECDGECETEREGDVEADSEVDEDMDERREASLFIKYSSFIEGTSEFWYWCCWRWLCWWYWDLKFVYLLLVVFDWFFLWFFLSDLFLWLVACCWNEDVLLVGSSEQKLWFCRVILRSLLSFASNWRAIKSIKLSVCFLSCPFYCYVKY